MKILDTNDLLDAAANVLSTDELETFSQGMTTSLTLLAQRVATVLGVDVHDVSHQPGFGGLCATFAPRRAGQPCPTALHDGDPSGDWESPTILEVSE